MIEWGAEDDDPFNPLFQMIAEEMLRQAASHSKEMNERCQADFREAVKRCEQFEDSLAVRKLLSDVLGKSTFELKDDAR